MRLPQQREPAALCAGQIPHSQSKRISVGDFVRPSLELRPAYSSGGTADCYARCALLPPGPVRDACIRNCY